MRRKPVPSATRSLTRRTFLKYTGATTLTLFAAGRFGLRRAIAAAIPGGSLDPLTVPKFVTPVLVPPVMAQGRHRCWRSGPSLYHYSASLAQEWGMV